MLYAPGGPCAGLLRGVAAAILLSACSLSEPSPLERLYDRLDSGGIVYFHADFTRLAASPAWLGLVEAIGGGALEALQPEFAVGVVMPRKTQLVIGGGSAYKGALAALGSASVEKLGDRLLLVGLDNRRPLAPPLKAELPLPPPDGSAAAQIRFRPTSLYALAEIAPRGFNFNFLAKSLENAQTASLIVPGECLRCLRLTLDAGDAARAEALRESLSESLQFIEAVTRAAAPSSAWLPAIEGCSIERGGTEAYLSLELTDGILLDLQNRLSRPETDR